MRTRERPFNDRSLNRGSRAMLLLALAYVVSASLLVSFAYRQPSDGWATDTNGDVPTAVAIQHTTMAHKIGLVLCSFVFAPERGREK